MSRKVFNYNGIANIGIECPNSLLERIAENLEGETESNHLDCRVSIIESNPEGKIVKDKEFDYLTLQTLNSGGVPIFRYVRYNTPIREIVCSDVNDYHITTFVAEDEVSGLICIRNFLSRHPSLCNNSLLHASLVDVEGKGTLIVGDSRSGKTTLAIYIMQEMGARLVSDENVFLLRSDGHIIGLYVPKNPRVRFSSIFESKLNRVLSDISLTHATQYIDEDAIQKIIQTRSFYVDAGLAFSRHSLAKLLGTDTVSRTLITKIIFPVYTDTPFVIQQRLDFFEGWDRLMKYGIALKHGINCEELQKAEFKLERDGLCPLEFFEIAFSSFDNLKREGIKI